MRPTDSSGPRSTHPGVLVAGYALLFAVALAHFLAFYSARGNFVGRDAAGHVYAFLNSLYGINRSPNRVLQFLLGFEANYGVALRALTLPFWWALGARPEAFGAVNLLLFAVTMLLLGASLKRTGGDAGWVPVLGLAILGVPEGTVLYVLYGIDAITALACLLVFHVAVARRADWRSVAVVALAGIFVRLNVLFYLAGPVVLEFVLWLRARRRRGLADHARRVADAPVLWWALLVGLAALDALFYLPQIRYVHDYVFSYEDFSLGNQAYAPGLWTIANWTWFFRHLDVWFSLPVGLLLVPFAVWGWWRGFVGRRLRVAVFVLSPLVLYSFIMGTRVSTYIVPSVLVFLLCTVRGLSLVRPRVLAWPVVTLLLLASFARIWVYHDLDPIPWLRQGTPAHKVARALVPPRRVFSADDGEKGEYDRGRRLYGEMFPGRERVEVGTFTFAEIAQRQRAATLVTPFLGEFRTRARIYVIEPRVTTRPSFDAVLVVTRGRDETDRLPAFLRPRYRWIGAITITPALSAQVYLPARAQP